MAAMMGGTMAALGFGAVGMLAMKVRFSANNHNDSMLGVCNSLRNGLSERTHFSKLN